MNSINVRARMNSNDIQHLVRVINFAAQANSHRDMSLDGAIQNLCTWIDAAQPVIR